MPIKRSPHHAPRCAEPSQHERVSKEKRIQSEIHDSFLSASAQSRWDNLLYACGNNLPRGATSPYYCMPDMYWSNETDRCAGCLGHWNNSDIANNMQSNGQLMAGNEWDAFDPSRFFELPAVFATIFRKPLDRAVSQFRFECIEDRGCRQDLSNITQWWDDQKKLLPNVYTWTFTNSDRYSLSNVSRSNRPEDGNKRGKLVGTALDTLSQFQLVLVMEWLGYASAQVKSILGFFKTDKLTHRVRPHVEMYARNDGQEVNRLSASGVGLASWNPKDYTIWHWI